MVGDIWKDIRGGYFIILEDLDQFILIMYLKTNYSVTITKGRLKYYEKIA